MVVVGGSVGGEQEATARGGGRVVVVVVAVGVVVVVVVWWGWCVAVVHLGVVVLLPVVVVVRSMACRAGAGWSRSNRHAPRKTGVGCGGVGGKRAGRGPGRRGARLEEVLGALAHVHDPALGVEAVEAEALGERHL